MVKDALSGARCASLACPYQHYLGYERGLEPKENEPLRHAGSVIHVGLSVWYDPKASKPDPDITREDRALCVAHHDWGDFEPFGKYSYLTWGHVECVLRDYFDYWRDRETFTVLDVNYNGKRICSEEMISHDFREDEFSEWCTYFTYRGRLDLPVRDSSGHLYVMDHKATTGNMGDFWFAQHAISNKNRGYAALLGAVLGERVHGVVINGIYMGAQPRKPDSAHQRRTFLYGVGHLDAWLDNTQKQLAEIRWRRDNDCWPQQAGFLCRGCDFLEVCKVETLAMRERVLKRDYKEKGDEAD